MQNYIKFDGCTFKYLDAQIMATDFSSNVARTAHLRMISL